MTAAPAVGSPEWWLDRLGRRLTERAGEKRALWNKQDTIRHDPAALQAALRELLA